jgi:hypothetical protein
MIIALAGRRVDAIDAGQPRFPLQNVERVGASVRALFQERGATAVVSSAACGADLIALSEAGKLGLRRRIVLPFSRARFRETSVVDRPGEWGEIYDSILDQVTAEGGLIVIEMGTDNDPYSTANKAILDEGIELGQECGESVVVFLIWDRVPRGTNDYTQEFGVEARKRGLAVFEIRTI